MTTSQPRQHHFVPVTLLKRFTDEAGWLHAFRFTAPSAGVFQRRPTKLFKERDLYTVKDALGEADNKIELALAHFESDCEHVFARIVDAARTGRPPGLTPKEEAIWLRFMFLQWKRVPDLHLTTTTDVEADAMLDEIFAEAQERFPHQRAELDRLSQPSERARVIKRARVDGLGAMSSEVFEALRSRGVRIMRIARQDKRFIIGSRPVVKLTYPGKADIRHPECELWLPIASDVMVGLGRGVGTETLVDCSSENVRYINLAITTQSTMIASGSAALTRSLANAR